MAVVRDHEWPWFLWFAWFPVQCAVVGDRHWLEWVWVRPVIGGWEYQKVVHASRQRKSKYVQRRSKGSGGSGGGHEE
jgi:hypothetical protein